MNDSEQAHSREASGGNVDGSHRCAAGDTTSSSAPPAHVTSGTHAFAAILREQAPTQLSMIEAVDLTQACKYFLADEVIALMPVYLAPILQGSQPEEVR
jgi:hypothetical protein